MQDNPGHQPQRFEEYTQLPNKDGFTISGTKFVFFYDRHGGWKDQYGNYYNEDGKPDEQPDSNSERSVSQGSWDEIDDYYEKEFAPSTDVVEEFQKSAEILEAIAQNTLELQAHAKDNPLRVNFKITDLGSDDEMPTEKQLTQSYKKKVKGVINAFYDAPKDCDTGYFVVSNTKQALNLINLQGQNIVGYDLTFDVEPIEELKDEPITEKEQEDRYPKFAGVNKNEKLYTFHLGNHVGFGDKKLFKQWTSKLKNTLQLFQIVKMRVNQNKQKIPVVKILESQVPKAKQVLFDGKEVVVEEYKPLEKKEQEKTEEKQQIKEEKKQESTQATSSEPAKQTS